MTSKPEKSNVKKEGRISYSDSKKVAKQAMDVLNEIKAKSRELKTIIVAIDKRTCIELPANLSQAERDERVATYIRVHNI